MTVTVIRTTGREEAHEVLRQTAMLTIGRLIGAGDRGLDVVNLHDGRVMLVDGHGYETTPETEDRGGIALVRLKPTRARLPVNETATALYLATCRPGVTHQIVGDVAIARDEDFA